MNMRATIVRSLEDTAVPPVDPELVGRLGEILQFRPSSITSSMIAAERTRWASSVLSDRELGMGGLFAREDYTVGDDEIPVLFLRPALPGPLPLIVNIHGGGLFSGHNRSPELLGDLARAAAVGACVASVDYRLAPEHPHPRPVLDCFDALSWMFERAGELGVDRDAVVLSGASAGAALAAGTTLMARDRGGPPVAGQMLLCPMLDDRVDSASAHQMDGHGLWDATSNRTGWSALLGDDRGRHGVSAYAAPARADDLSGLPSTYVDVGAFEALRNEALSFATRIGDAGGAAELHVWGGAFHSFDEWEPSAEVSRAASAARLSWLRRTLRIR